MEQEKGEGLVLPCAVATGISQGPDGAVALKQETGLGIGLLITTPEPL